MPHQTITIRRQSIGHHTVSDAIDADVEGPFAIHETIPVSLGGWTLTHVPTGWSCVKTAHRVAAVAARAELLASGLDWSFTDPRAITDEQRRVGRTVKGTYEGK